MPIWNNAMDVAVVIFDLTKNLPRTEDYGLTSQIRRSAESISANIAEGFGKTTAKDKSRFYDIAKGSAYETKSHLLYGVKVNYFNSLEIGPIIKNIEMLVYEINKINKVLRGRE